MKQHAYLVALLAGVASFLLGIGAVYGAVVFSFIASVSDYLRIGLANLPLLIGLAFVGILACFVVGPLLALLRSVLMLAFWWPIWPFRLADLARRARDPLILEDGRAITVSGRPGYIFMLSCSWLFNVAATYFALWLFNALSPEIGSLVHQSINLMEATALQIVQQLYGYKDLSIEMLSPGAFAQSPIWFALFTVCVFLGVIQYLFGGVGEGSADNNLVRALAAESPSRDADVFELLGVALRALPRVLGYVVERMRTRPLWDILPLAPAMIVLLFGIGYVKGSLDLKARAPISFVIDGQATDLQLIAALERGALVRELGGNRLELVKWERVQSMASSPRLPPQTED